MLDQTHVSIVQVEHRANHHSLQVRASGGAHMQRTPLKSYTGQEDDNRLFDLQHTCSRIKNNLIAGCFGCKGLHQLRTDLGNLGNHPAHPGHQHTCMHICTLCVYGCVAELHWSTVPTQFHNSHCIEISATDKLHLHHSASQLH